VGGGACYRGIGHAVTQMLGYEVLKRRELTRQNSDIQESLHSVDIPAVASILPHMMGDAEGLAN